ncbi:MAG TPA: hypothetical protein EYO22_02160 [Candidatus Poseidoniales archaeon]|nr:hypothetical protein [Candidatus Poseidoniales archaeon]HIB23501.1 hypothetical protein [Candidatus Poseidoniales archaeon]HIB42350.1 hypothetical protein [Candidatus Poseidoniales archaeon]HIO24874.1 hypothetical protein [Candidatus Poseidoniales archaeon]
MTDDSKISLKEYWASFSGKMVEVGGVADQKLQTVKKKTFEAAKKTADKSREIKSRARDAVEKRATRANPKYSELETIHGVIPLEPILPPVEKLAEKEGKIAIPIDEYRQMQCSVNELQKEQQRTSELVEKIISLEAVNEEVQVEQTKSGWSLISRRGEIRELQPQQDTSELPEHLTKEVGKSLRESTTILGVSVIWLAGLVGVDYYVELAGYSLWNYSPSLIVWSFGTGAWSLFVLWRLKKAKTILSMPLGMRIQTSFGLGLATAMALILMEEQQLAITNVWGWSATVSLTALLLSGFFRGIYGSLRRVGTKRKRPKN